MAGRAIIAMLPLASLSIVFAAVGGQWSGGSASAETARTTTVETARTTATSAHITTTTIRTTTTLRSTTTTIQPGPASKLKIYDEAYNPRFNPCNDPIEIKLNPGGHLSEVDIANVEEFLRQQADQLSVLTGVTIVYDGLTSQASVEVYQGGEYILLHFGLPGEGLLEVGSDGPRGWSFSWDRLRGNFMEINAFKIQVNAELISYGSSPLDNADKRFLMLLLGESLGLDILTDEDMLRADPPGDPSSWSREIMYVDSYFRSSDAPAVWGAGDAYGFAVVGANSGCF